MQRQNVEVTPRVRNYGEIGASSFKIGMQMISLMAVFRQSQDQQRRVSLACFALHLLDLRQ